MTVEDEAILCNYLPLVREYIPSAATEIESDIFSKVSSDGIQFFYISFINPNNYEPFKMLVYLQI